MKRNLIVLVAVLLLAGLAIYQNVTAKGREASVPTTVGVKPGFLAPSFTLKSIDGKDYSIGGKRDKPVWLNFWASWCGPCQLEAPDLQKLYEKYGSQLDIVTVNVTRYDDVKDVQKFIKDNNWTLPVLLDKDLAASEPYQANLLPTSFLIDKNGAIVDVVHLLEPKEMEKKAKSLIDRS